MKTLAAQVSVVYNRNYFYQYSSPGPFVILGYSNTFRLGYFSSPIQYDKGPGDEVTF